MSEVSVLIDKGHIMPVVSSVLPLSEAAEGHKRIEGKHTRGKIVLKVI
jgi:NADPH:quinone reductase-like Zn-dependent oxidoreductase